MFELIFKIIEHPKVFLTGLLIGYLAPSNLPTVAGQLGRGVINVLNWIKGKL